MTTYNTVTVTLPEEHWVALMKLTYLGCQLRGGNWVGWASNVNRAIQTAITDAENERRIAQSRYYEDEMDEPDLPDGYEDWDDFLSHAGRD